MAGVCLLVVFTGLLLKVCGLAAEVTEANAGAVFVSQQAAHAVLLRQRRYNSGHLEELHKDNLERECKEEVCTMEEAREVFENDEKTMEFWAGYVDGDQCKPPPCQNGGVCEDGVGTYVCWCKPNFGGKNCEIEVTKQCLVNNGGCSHFCMMREELPVCQCAAGYKLGPDKRSCVPTETFSCGKVILSKSESTARFLLTPRTSNQTRANVSTNVSDALHDVFYDDNITQLYDYDFAMNDSDLTDVPAASAIDIRTFQSSLSSSLNPADDPVNSSEWNGETDFKSWAFFPTLPSITAEENTDQRIVGGDEAIPGEIPWQVALMSHSPTLGRAQSFCGGSLLSESWVITAAHCLVLGEVPVRGFFVRVGEHDVEKHEGSEKDHSVAEQHLHPMYNRKKSPYNHDIALLKLTSPVELSNRRRPICLGHKDFTETILRESHSSLVSGWGRQKFLGIEATKLQKLEVPYVDRTLCKQSSRDHITRYMFCAGYGNKEKDSCQGDSGGPHATSFKGTWFLTGIVSWGEECAKDGKYGIYTRVSRYYPWISFTTGIQIN
ncbi:coagulation factor IX-like [Solea senegalensis]|uniref:Coagulation factor IX n=2 Tax=Solea senegalensis TaxID=28829 RepID=A0AAV6SF66_SOLSE|nr:coagulation factor IXb [Solea senegalensis]KAG7516159.1 coagulation factor IX-like [Solea senegalensis]